MWTSRCDRGMPSRFCAPVSRGKLARASRERRRPERFRRQSGGTGLGTPFANAPGSPLILEDVMIRVGLAFVLIALCAGCSDSPPRTTPDPPLPNRPKVPGTLRLTLRERDREQDSKARVAEIDWKVS